MEPALGSRPSLADQFEPLPETSPLDAETNRQIPRDFPVGSTLFACTLAQPLRRCGEWPTKDVGNPPAPLAVPKNCCTRPSKASETHGKRDPPARQSGAKVLTDGHLRDEF